MIPLAGKEGGIIKDLIANFAIRSWKLTIH